MRRRGHLCRLPLLLARVLARWPVGERPLRARPGRVVKCARRGRAPRRSPCCRGRANVSEVAEREASHEDGASSSCFSAARRPGRLLRARSTAGGDARDGAGRLCLTCRLQGRYAVWIPVHRKRPGQAGVDFHRRTDVPDSQRSAESDSRRIAVCKVGQAFAVGDCLAHGIQRFCVEAHIKELSVHPHELAFRPCHREAIVGPAHVDRCVKTMIHLQRAPNRDGWT